MSPTLKISSSNYINDDQTTQSQNGFLNNNYQWPEYDGHISDSRGGGFGGISEIIEEEEEEDEDMRSELSFAVNSCGGKRETIKEEELETCKLFSNDFGSLYFKMVHVWINGNKTKLNMDALHWALTHCVNPLSCVVSLVCIFPAVTAIPSLFGKIPIDEANPEQREIYLAYKLAKRKRYIHKFRNLCSAFQVNVDIALLESNTPAHAMVKLIPAYDIRKLIIGTSKRDMKSSKNEGGEAGIILRGAPEYCNVTIICDRKEVEADIFRVSDTTTSTTTFTQFPNQLLIGDAIYNNNNKNNYRFCLPCFNPKTY